MYSSLLQSHLHTSVLVLEQVDHMILDSVGQMMSSPSGSPVLLWITSCASVAVSPGVCHWAAGENHQNLPHGFSQPTHTFTHEMASHVGPVGRLDFIVDWRRKLNLNLFHSSTAQLMSSFRPLMSNIWLVTLPRQRLLQICGIWLLQEDVLMCVVVYFSLPPSIPLQVFISVCQAAERFLRAFLVFFLYQVPVVISPSLPLNFTTVRLNEVCRNEAESGTRSDATPPQRAPIVHMCA